MPNAGLVEESTLNLVKRRLYEIYSTRGDLANKTLDLLVDQLAGDAGTSRQTVLLSLLELDLRGVLSIEAVENLSDQCLRELAGLAGRLDYRRATGELDPGTHEAAVERVTRLLGAGAPGEIPSLEPGRQYVTLSFYCWRFQGLLDEVQARICTRFRAARAMENKLLLKAVLLEMRRTMQSLAQTPPGYLDPLESAVRNLRVAERYRDLATECAEKIALYRSILEASQKGDEGLLEEKLEALCGG